MAAADGAQGVEVPEGLRHVQDDQPGIRRHKHGKGFRYVDDQGRPVSDRMRERIESLKIPPAWKDVWICPFTQGHIQATGYDERGRKQYLYHPEWRRVQDAAKFDRVVAFGRALPTLRSYVQADLRKPESDFDRVVAAVVRAMDHTFIRVGSAAYARENRSYGMTTLEDEHLVSADSRRVRFRFEGKGGKVQEVGIEDPRVAKVIQRAQEMSGERLFEYRDEEGRPRAVESGDVNVYLRRAMGRDFSSKDFRTWAATTLMTAALKEAGPRETKKEREEVVREAVKEVAERLGNTPAVCKKSYIHPAVPAAYLEGTFQERIKGAERIEDLWPEERITLHLLETYGSGR